MLSYSEDIVTLSNRPETSGPILHLLNEVSRYQVIMDIHDGKTKRIITGQKQRVSQTTEEQADELFSSKFKYPVCERKFVCKRGLAGHRAQRKMKDGSVGSWCTGNRFDRSRKGTKAHKAVEQEDQKPTIYISK